MKSYTIRKAAELYNLCWQRIHAKIKEGHYPNAYRCECGTSVMIPAEDVKADMQRRKQNGR